MRVGDMELVRRWMRVHQRADPRHYPRVHPVRSPGVGRQVDPDGVLAPADQALTKLLHPDAGRDLLLMQRLNQACDRRVVTS